VTKPELGTKRECPECAVKYYDLGRSPCVCPKCSTSFELDVAPPSRAVRAVKAEKPKAAEKPEAAPPDEKVEVVSLDELGAEEQDGEENMEDGDEAALADIDIPDEDDDDDETETNDAFLDTEDDDSTDVSGLLGTDIGKGNDEG